MAEAGWYLYGIERTGAGPIPELPGLDPGFQLEVVHFKDLMAVISRVDRETFSPVDGPGAMQERPITWLANKALEHQGIVEVLASRATILPAGFGTVFRSHSRVQAMLEHHYKRMWLLLKRLDGRIELGVKVYCDHQVLRNLLLQTQPELQSLSRQIETAKGGRAYLLQRRLELRSEEMARSQCLSDVKTIAGLLAKAAEETRNLDIPAGPAGSSYLVLNGAYLIPRDEMSRFCSLITELQWQWQEAGIRLTLSGPWPPYSFSSLDEPMPLLDKEVAL